MQLVQHKQASKQASKKQRKKKRVVTAENERKKKLTHAYAYAKVDM